MRQKRLNVYIVIIETITWVGSSVTRLGCLLDFGQVFKAFGNN